MHGPNRQKAFEMTSDQESHHEEETLELSGRSETSEGVKQLATGVVFAALSIAMTPIAGMIPRIPGWNIALFDPVSLFWIIAFLVGGPKVGSFSTLTGFVGLFFFDPSAPIGPILKLVATSPMIVVPLVGVVLRGGWGETLSSPSDEPLTGDKRTGGSILSNPLFYAVLMFCAYLLRLVIMVPLNLMIVPALYGPLDPGFIVTYTIILNSSQSVFDAVVPWAVVFPTTVFKHFRLW
jgi:hypothetical protein